MIQLSNSAQGQMQRAFVTTQPALRRGSPCATALVYG